MSPKVGPTRRPSPRERLLAACDELFYRDGLGAGIDQVIEKANVAKGSLYYNFEGKDDLITAYLDARHDAWIARVTAAMRDLDDPAERILAVFDAIGDYIAIRGFQGSEFVNAAAEARDNSAVMKAAKRFRRSLHKFFTDLATQTGVDDPTVLAQQLIILHDGAIATAHMDKASRATAVTARNIARLTLQAAGVDVRSAR
jgi:AcrR family transcriptional regulator